MSRGAFVIFSKQAQLVSHACDIPTIDAIFKAAVGFGASVEGEPVSGALPTQADFSHFNTAVQAIAARQQSADECTPEILQSFAQTHLTPLLRNKLSGEVPEPCLLMWEDAYVDACSSSFRERLQLPFNYYSQAVRSTQQYLIDRYARVQALGAPHSCLEHQNYVRACN